MAKTMRVREIVDEMSELYRAERKKGRSIYEEYSSVVTTLNQHKEDGWGKITVAEHERLKQQKCDLEQDKKLQDKYCDGIFVARELLMRLGFDTVVEIDD